MKSIFAVCFIISILALIIFPTGSVLASEKVLLEYNYQQGESLTYNVRMKGQVSMKTAAQSQSTPINVDIEIGQNVLHVNPNNGRIDIQTVIRKGTMVDEQGLLMSLENEGNTAYMTMEKNGALLGVTTFDANFDPTSVSISFPEKPIGIGETWNVEIPQNPQVPIPMNARYTLRSIQNNGKLAIIQTSITPADDLGGALVGAKANGEIHFDIQRGRITKNIQDTEIEMMMEVRNDDPELGPPAKPVTTRIEIGTIIELQ